MRPYEVSNWWYFQFHCINRFLCNPGHLFKVIGKYFTCRNIREEKKH